MSAYDETQGSNIGKWAGIGCVTLLLSCFLCSAIFGFSILGILKNSEAHSLAMGAAQVDPRVEEELGLPLEPGFWVTGNINRSANHGEATLRIPVEGPKGTGTVNTEAQKSMGEWQLIYLDVEVDASAETILIIDDRALQP